MKVVPQFCPVARNFLLRALECSVEHRSRVGAFPLFGPTPRSVLSRFITNLIGKVWCSLRRRPLTVGVSRERASKIPYGICPYFSSKKRFNLSLFSTFLPLPLFRFRERGRNKGLFWFLGPSVIRGAFQGQAKPLRKKGK